MTIAMGATSPTIAAVLSGAVLVVCAVVAVIEKITRGPDPWD